MDLYYTAASVLLFGAIFAIIVYYVGMQINLAEVIQQTLRKDPETNSLDVASVSHDFTVDRSAFTQFVMGQQSKHQVFLCDWEPVGLITTLQDDSRWAMPLANLPETYQLVWVLFHTDVSQDLPSGVSVADEFEYVPALSATPDYLNELAIGSPMHFRRAIDVTGISGSFHNVVEAFVEDMITHNWRNVHVQRYLNSDGSVVLFCSPIR